MTASIPCTVLGATGVVGQRFVARLARHPWFRLAHLAASERSVGRAYGEACTWQLPDDAHGGHAGCGARTLLAATPEAAFAPVVFSALDSGPARDIEPAFAAAGAVVFSNASAFRMDPVVPLLVPEVNPEHLELLEKQRAHSGGRGGIVCNPNCTATVLVMALAPLHRAFGVEAVHVASMQAVSGAGWPGVSSLDILGNVIPHIRDEEEKVAEETARMLGTCAGGRVTPAAVTVSAACHRVPVLDGHTEAVSVRLRGDPSPEAVAECLAEFRGEPQRLALPSAPERPLRVHAAPDRPQVRRDVGAGDGMVVHVGRVRRCPLLGIKFVVMGHNAERGAAGASLLNAELAHARGLLAG
jgi:aspartate-semialdehyde dehydrogenase